MKLWIKHIAILAVIVVAGGVITVVLGIVPIAASSPHWPITKWFLEFSMERSVATHSIKIATPDLDDAALVIKGAGHFATGCVQCHGSPARGPSPIAESLMPQPPKLSDTVSEWKPRELFYIVKHGVKLTGMPGWPAQNRDDEVWAVVAFLKTLPGMSRAEYHNLVFGDAAAASDSVPSGLQHLVTDSCGRCHGADGLGRDGVFPILAGQRKDYLASSLRAYSAGERHSGFMQPVAVPLEEQQIDGLAAFYSELPSPLGDAIASEPDGVAAGNPEDDRDLTGQQIAQSGIPARRVPACVGCHAPSIAGNYPLLNGQPQDYLAQQLNLFKQRVRGGTKNAHLMHPATERITEQQEQAVAEFFAAE